MIHNNTLHQVLDYSNGIPTTQCLGLYWVIMSLYYYIGLLLSCNCQPERYFSLYYYCQYVFLCLPYIARVVDLNVQPIIPNPNLVPNLNLIFILIVNVIVNVIVNLILNPNLNVVVNLHVALRANIALELTLLVHTRIINDFKLETIKPSFDCCTHRLLIF